MSAKRKVDNDELVRLWGEELSTKAIAGRFGVASGTVYRRLRALDLCPHRKYSWGNREDIPPEEIARLAAEMRNAKRLTEPDTVSPERTVYRVARG